MILSRTKKFITIFINNQKIPASSPLKNSSKITFEDLNFPLNISVFRTCLFVLQIVTPLPAANPSAFTTIGSYFIYKTLLPY